MVSLRQRGGKLTLTAFALAFAVWIFSSSPAMAQRGGHAGGGMGHMGGMRHTGGFGNRGFGGFGGYGYYPGFYDPGFSGYGYGYGYGYSDFGAIGTSFGFPFSGYGNGYGYGLTNYNTGFTAPGLGFGY